MSRFLRWSALLGASLLLHLLAFDLVGGIIGMPAWRNPDSTLIIAELKTTAAPIPAALPVPQPKTRPSKPRAKPRRAAPPPSPAPVAQTVPLPLAGDQPPDIPGETTIDAGSSESVPPTDVLVTEQASPPERELRYKVDPPPPAELKYDVQALREGRMVYGSGTIVWQSENGNYTITGEAGVLFFTVLNFHSEGVIDEFGVAPVMYSEKRFRRPETNTHFHRERNTISFSASTASYSRKGGEQDRASVIWQLAGIGRADSGKFMPDTEIDIFVAGVRNAETWRIRVVGEEEIGVGTGRITAWHVVRIPRRGSYDQTLDIWLAPQQEWYPVKLRYTEVNGDYLDLSLSNIYPIAPR